MNVRVTTPVTADKTSRPAAYTISHWRGDRTLLELLLVWRRVRWCLWSVVAIVATLRLKESTTRSAGLVGIFSPEPLNVTRLLVLPCPSRRRDELWRGRARLGWGRRGWEMELRPRPGVSGLPVKPRATSLDRKSAGLDKVDDVTNETLVSPPSSATGVTRGGKSPSRILPAEGGRKEPPFLYPAMRVREEPSGRSKGTCPVAEGKPGDAATRAGELRPIDNLKQSQQ